MDCDKRCRYAGPRSVDALVYAMTNSGSPTKWVRKGTPYCGSASRWVTTGSRRLYQIHSILVQQTVTLEMPRQEACQVLIVGAGPVGLLLALLLKKKGVHVILVDRQKALYPLPRAVAFDHESRRLFGSAGLSKEIEAICENVVMDKGGEDGVNFVWRDADLKR